MSWNLPPGCTQADIDRAMGGGTPCSFCGVDIVHDEDAERVYWRGKVRVACSECAARAEDEDR